MIHMVGLEKNLTSLYILSTVRVYDFWNKYWLKRHHQDYDYNVILDYMYKRNDTIFRNVWMDGTLTKDL